LDLDKIINPSFADHAENEVDQVSNTMANVSEGCDDDDAEKKPSVSYWLELTEGKQWSRLLYTNPVCFLCCSGGGSAQKNVMVLSWLTATNNHGSFLFSLGKRRHTATMLLLQQQQETTTTATVFTLSVPVQGMEELVRAVGSVSGRTARKFATPQQQQQQQQQPKEDYVTRVDDSADQQQQPPISKRQKKKMLRQDGIPGLKAVPVGHSIPQQQHDALHLFCIDGTVAHLVCRVTRIHDDEHHLLIRAQVERAYVQSSYWDGDKNLFRPSQDTPPYLTFFGSQVFGYVVTEDQI
jgi:flavin reductase (DIM6/NTAB) family NADH-FMN oxidoreductase RutF